MEEGQPSTSSTHFKADDKEVMDDTDLMARMGLPKAFSANLNSSRYYCEIW